MPEKYSSEDNEWREYCLCRCSELEPKVLGANEPSPEDAMIYFKYHQILNKTFRIGRDYSNHPRNPFKGKSGAGDVFVVEKTLDNTQKTDTINSMNEKDAKLVEFLQATIDTLRPRVFTPVEPHMSDRMTFFAYANFLKNRYGIGDDFKTHPRNPWKDCEAPLDFNDYSQIRPLPSDFATGKSENPNAKTTVIPTLPVVEIMHRVFDKNVPTRTVYQGTEGKCYAYTKKANEDCGMELFDYEPTSVKWTKEKNGVNSSPVNQRIKDITPTGCCQRNTSWFQPKKSAKERVAEYLKNCQANAETTKTETTETK